MGATPGQILDLAASDMNDTAQTVYTREAMLPYFNMAIQELLNRMQDNNIPITTRENDQLIRITANQSTIRIAPITGSLPAEWVNQLPFNLVDIREIWESDNQKDWTQMRRVDKINPNISGQTVSSFFQVYEWHGYYMRVPPVNKTMYLNLHYVVKNIPIFITIADFDTQYDIDAILFLAHKTAALCAALVAQDETRAGALNDLAEQAAEREINIPTKGNQQIATRRRPFRASYKMRGYSW